MKSDTTYDDDDGPPSGTQDETWQTLVDSGGTDVSAGDSVTIVASTSGAFDSATVRLIWENDDGSTSAELGKWEGPDA